MKIAVTGGTGFIGRHLVRALLDAGHEVVVLARGTNSEKSLFKEDDKVEMVEASLADGAKLAAAIRGCDAVYHCVGINREKGEQTFLKVHVQGTNNLLSAFRQTGVKRLIMVSFLRAASRTDSPYHMTKWMSEEAVRESGLNYTIFKPGVVFGEGDGFVTNMKKTIQSLPFFGLPGLRATSVSPVYVGDFCQAMVAVLEDQETFKKTYSYVGPEELTLAEIVDKVADSINIIPTKIPMPVFVHRIAALAMENLMPEPLLTSAQVTMLSESLSEPEPATDPLPEHLKATTKFLEASKV